jgi:WD40 repeat protein
VETGKATIPNSGHQGEVVAIAFSSDSTQLASLALDDSVHLWDAASAKDLHQYKIVGPDHTSPGPITSRGVAFLADGTTLAVVGDSRKGDDGRRNVQVWDLAAQKKTREIPTNFTYPDIDVSPDGAMLASATAKGIELRSLDTGRELGVLDFLEGAKKRYHGAGCPTFAPDGRTIATGCSDKKIRIWDWAKSKILLEIPIGEFGTRYLAYSPDGLILASCGTASSDQPDVPILLWEVLTGQLIGKLTGHKGKAVCVALSPDGITLASAGEDDNTVRVWNVFTGEQVAKLEGHTGAVKCVAFSPDGKLLASGSADTTVLLWDMTKIDRGLPAKVEKTDIGNAWADLASENRAVAYAAIPILIAGADDATAFLKERLKPAPEADERRIAKLISDLDNDDFDTRENATRELGKIGAVAEPLLKKALEDKPSKEAKRRLEELLPDGKAPVTSAEGLRELRALISLERIGSKEARDLVADLAKGAPAALLSKQAKFAQERMDWKGRMRAP